MNLKTESKKVPLLRRLLNTIQGSRLGTLFISIISWCLTKARYLLESIITILSALTQIILLIIRLLLIKISVLGIYILLRAGAFLSQSKKRRFKSRILSSWLNSQSHPISLYIRLLLYSLGLRYSLQEPFLQYVYLQLSKSSLHATPHGYR
jgi:hypothetical protein